MIDDMLRLVIAVATPIIILGPLFCWAVYVMFARAAAIPPRLRWLDERRDRSFNIALVSTLFSMLAVFNQFGMLPDLVMKAVGAVVIVLLVGYAAWLWWDARRRPPAGRP